jgi:hypothetical protein
MAHLSYRYSGYFYIKSILGNDVDNPATSRFNEGKTALAKDGSECVYV